MTATHLAFEPGPQEVVTRPVSRRRRFEMVRFLLRRSPVACILVGGFLICAIFGPWIEPYNPNTIDLLSGSGAPHAAVAGAPGSAAHRRQPRCGK